MGFVSSIKDFIGSEPRDDYDEYGEQFDEYEDEAEPVRRTSSKFRGRNYDSREAEPQRYSENDITIIKVRKYDDSQSIANVIKNHRAVIFDVIEMDNPDEAEKVVNFMTGAAYAVNGNLKRVSGGIFIATPENMHINSDEVRKKTNTSTFNMDL